jgi:hypothetical protein
VTKTGQINWNQSAKIIENANFQSLPNAKVITEKSLLPLLNLELTKPVLVTEELEIEVLDAFCFLLKHSAQTYIVNEENPLEARYLQQPHITMSKRVLATN